MKTPKSLFPILSVQKLSNLLSISSSRLEEVASTAGAYYRPFVVKQSKKDGTTKERKIDNPTGELKAIQSKVQKRLLNPVIVESPEGLMGGIPGRSIVSNASKHVAQEMVIAIDIRDCFPKTGYKKVYKIWKNDLGCGSEVARILTQLTTFNRKLPHGAPTSTSLINLVLLPLYQEIDNLASTKGATFTLYIDDITISGKAGECLALIDPIIKLIHKHGYGARDKKINIMPNNDRQEVTGIVVNEKLSIPKDRRESIQKEIIEASEIQVEKQHLESIRGKISSVTSVNSQQGKKLEMLASKLLEGY